MSRFYTAITNPLEIFALISRVLESIVVPYTIFKSAVKMHFSTVDSRMCQLTGEICVAAVGGEGVKNMVVFARHKGDPIEFTRFFRRIKSELLHIII